MPLMQPLVGPVLGLMIATGARARGSRAGVGPRRLQPSLALPAICPRTSLSPLSDRLLRCCLLVDNMAMLVGAEQVVGEVVVQGR